MDKGVRREHRRLTNSTYSISWQSGDKRQQVPEVKGVDISDSGVGIEFNQDIPTGSVIYVEARDGSLNGSCFVRHSTERGGKFGIGLEFSDETKARKKARTAQTGEYETSLYDVLQISPKADLETVHRVFRIMAARFHPDNPETGDIEKFLQLKHAYQILSDPQRRTEYDSQQEALKAGPLPVFELKDFVVGIDAEINRRLGVLCLLYNQRRADPDHPGVSLLELERKMGFPREYLNFTTWYLRAKEFVNLADNSDLAITAAGAEFVEEKAAHSEVLNNLLLACGSPVPAGSPPVHERERDKDKKERPHPPRLPAGSGSPRTGDSMIRLRTT